LGRDSPGYGFADASGDSLNLVQLTTTCPLVKPKLRNPLPRVRKLALSLPEAHEVEAWGEPTFRVKNKIFAMYAHANTHHGSGRNAVWCKAKPINQGLMIKAAPDRFFSPPYVGPGGWIGVWLDGDVDWDELLGLLTDGYRMAAPKKLLARLEDE
jgi:hypothetical protein